jgi:hypothetical protein
VVLAPFTTPSGSWGLNPGMGWLLYKNTGWCVWAAAMRRRPRPLRLGRVALWIHAHVPLVDGPSTAAEAWLAARIVRLLPTAAAKSGGC